MLYNVYRSFQTGIRERCPQMRYGLVLGVLGVVLVSHGVGSVPGGEAPASKGPVWLDDYAAARRAARLSGKPIFAVFR